MSKYLVKILSICAFVVMLPLIILGTALCVTETENYKLRLFVDGDNAEYTSCEVLINGEKRENNEITLIKNTEVVVSFVGEGYNFDKWYEGTNTTYQAENKVASENVSFTFKLTSNLDLTAKCAVKKYSVTYTGTYADGSNFDASVYETVNYQYGEPLKAIEPKDTDEYIMFAGWSVVSEDVTTAKPYKEAKFAEDGEYEVKAAWRDLKEETYTINVKNYAKSEQVDTITYNVVSGFSAYDTTNENIARSYYNFVGFNYKGVVYTYDVETKDYLSENIKLSDVLINDGEFNVDVVAEWKSQYESLRVNASGIYEVSDAESYYIYGKKDGDDNYYRLSTSTFNYDVNDTADGIYLEQMIKDVVLDGYTSFYYNDGGEYKEVVLSDLVYYYNATEFVNSFDDATFADMIDGLLSHGFDMSQTINVRLIFTIKSAE